MRAGLMQASPGHPSIRLFTCLVYALCTLTVSCPIAKPYHQIQVTDLVHTSAGHGVAPGRILLLLGSQPLLSRSHSQWRCCHSSGSEQMTFFDLALCCRRNMFRSEASQPKELHLHA